MSVKLELSVQGTSFQPGDTVSGTVKVIKGGHSRELEVFLLYRDATKDFSGTSTSVPSGQLHKGKLEAGQSFDFSLALPNDAKPAYDSEHGKLWWEVHARSEAFGPDAHAGETIEVNAA